MAIKGMNLNHLGGRKFCQFNDKYYNMLNKNIKPGVYYIHESALYKVVNKQRVDFDFSGILGLIKNTQSLYLEFKDGLLFRESNILEYSELYPDPLKLEWYTAMPYSNWKHQPIDGLEMEIFECNNYWLIIYNSRPLCVGGMWTTLDMAKQRCQLEYQKFQQLEKEETKAK